MIPSTQADVGGRRRQKHPALTILLTLFLALVLLLPQAAAAPQEAGQNMVGASTSVSAVPRAQAQTNTIQLEVVYARDVDPDVGPFKGDPVTADYQFQIVEDNTGSPFPLDDPLCFKASNPNYPEGCEWPGVRSTGAWAPIITQGDQDDLNETTGLTLPDGKYLISVLADGFRVDGEHFTLPMPEPGLVEVGVHHHPLPPAEMVILVFDDRSLTNGQYDAPIEQGLAGFRASVNDTAGEITTDIFGNPICTVYKKQLDPITGDPVLDPFTGKPAVELDGDGSPIVEKIGGECLSDETGTIRIPNLGTIRFDVLVTPPDGQTWIQTTTLEGSQGWDTWLQEAGSGLDNEFIIAAEPFPWTIFGFVQPTGPLPAADPEGDNGSISGVIMGITSYSPSQGGLPHVGDIWGGLMGVKLDRPIAYPWLSLNALQGGDQAIWVGQGDADGSFTIPNVPPGDYFLTYWDEKQHYILDFVNVTVEPGQEADVGVRTMTSWFAQYYGTVFLDYNENGRQDSGEPGVPDYLVVLRDRDNTEIDRMSIAALTDANGFWELEKGYPMTSWMVLEAYSDIYRTTGITYQASNQLEETTIMGPIVDVATLPILSQRGRLDWGVKFYEPGTNGGIAGSVFYDTVRAEDDAAFAGAEPWQPGIPGLTMRLYATVKDGAGNVLYDPVDGSAQKGNLLWVTETENFVRPQGCTVRDVNGDPVQFPSMPDNGAPRDCLEAPLTGIQFGTDQQPLPGNWGFGDGCFTTAGDPGVYDEAQGPDAGACTGGSPTPLPPGDYLVEVVIPDDPILGRPLYQVTREEDVNIYDGDEFYPLIPPPPCAGPLHEVDIAGIAPDGTLTTAFDTPNAVDNPGYVEVGGSRFEGQEMPLCNVKLVNVADQKSVAPIFTLWTEVPIPGRWRGYIIDDLNVSSNPLELTFGEKTGLPNLPIGVYDFTGRLVHTIASDFHGVYEVILPSVATYNTPTPSGMNAGMYYIYGNDPGQPNNINANYNPQYRSIGTTFEIYPGVIVPSDLAPVQNGALIWAPGSQQSQLARCEVNPARPQLFAADHPYASKGGQFTITGRGFGASPNGGYVTLVDATGDPTRIAVPATQWSETQLTVRIPNGRTFLPGAYQVHITNGSGLSTINGLTFHVLGTGYNPDLFEVGPTMPYTTIQSALDDAADAGDSLVVVYPGATSPFTNPLGIWFENPVIYSPVKLQGVGPGGIYTDGTHVAGTILDGRGMGGNEVYAGWWRTLVGDIWLNRGGWSGSPVDGDGNPRIYEGPVVTVFAEDGEFTDAFPASIDGFTIQGGDQQGMPNNFNNLGQPIPGVAPEIVIQGGGIFVNGYARHLRITNNVIQGNGGAYAGAIRVGTPDVPEPLKDHQNDNIYIGYNRILANGGTNLAGGIGMFAGAENYDIAYNDICGNTSAEYGGGISHYGESPGGQIHHNRIIFNRAYDEGGGIMIAGELPVDPNLLSDGAGAVDIHANLIQGNLSNDDGGGLRFLMAGVENFRVYNNIIANNVSTHEGGGVSINDAPYLQVINNTIMKNITTATGMTSNGLPQPAGLSSSRNSNLLQATLPADMPLFSDPTLFNNLFWDNRAGSWTGGGVAGIGQEGDLTPIFHWDLGVAGGAGELSPKYCLMQVPNGLPDPSNLVGLDPLVVQEYDLTVKVFPWRGNPNFVGADIVAVDMPLSLLGDYHLSGFDSPAVDAGWDMVDGFAAPNQDIDEDSRPARGKWDIGADEITRPFPGTGILWPPAPAAAGAAGASLPAAGEEGKFLLYLPIFLKNSTGWGGDWAGQPENFLFDPISGASVLQSGYTYWNSNRFSRDLEAYLTFTGVSAQATRQDLLLKIGGLTPEGTFGADTYLINIHYNAVDSEVQVMTMEPGEVWKTHITFGGIDFVEGDFFGARTNVGGMVDVFRNQELIGRVDLTAGGDAWPYREGYGAVGVWFEAPDFGQDGAGFTDFGGGTIP
jgi:hypothetical protein